MSLDPALLAIALADAGFVAADEEAAELLAAADGDGALLGDLVKRRLTGEPLAWITGRAVFCGLTLRIDRGVYVPRWQSEALALRAAERLPPTGIAVDLCTGSGAVAKVLSQARPGAHVVASDMDPSAAACAVANGVEAYCGDLFAPLPASVRAQVDVVVGVVPYVPTLSLPLLQRDTLAFESTLSYDGGADGIEVLRRAIAGSAHCLRRGGAVLLELGGDEADAISEDLSRLGFIDVGRFVDSDGDVRGIEATLAP